MDGLSIPAIKVAAVKAYFPDVKLARKDANYVNGMFRAIPAAGGGRRNDGVAPMRLDDNNRVAGGRIPPELREAPRGFQRQDQANGPTMDDYRQRRNDAEEDRHRRPLAVSKSNPHRETDGYPAVQGSMLENMR
jgi:hypothetical protein